MENALLEHGSLCEEADAQPTGGWGASEGLRGL